MAGAYSVSLLGDLGAPVLAQIWQKTRVGDEPPATGAAVAARGPWTTTPTSRRDRSIPARAWSGLV